MTEVHRVKDVVSGQELVLKILRQDAPREAEVWLRREFHFLSSFTHPCIVRAFDFGFTSDRRPYFTMEFCDGLPIDTYFSSGYTSELAEVTIQVLRALESIHVQGLLHCDLKPQHILVRGGVADGNPLPQGGADGKPLPQGGGVEVKVLDFGFAERVALIEGLARHRTLGYVAPEVLKGIDADARADLYSLGLVLYKVMTGRGPGVDDESMREWLRMQYYSELEPVRKFDPGIPEEFEAVVMSLVRRGPERRPGSASAVIEALAGAGASASQVKEVSRRLLAPGFVGRTVESATLKELLARAGQGRASAVCISGERGVGKTRLLSEFKFVVQLEGATILTFEPILGGARPQSLVELVIQRLGGVDAHGLAPAATDKHQLFEAVVQGLRQFCASDRVGRSLVLLVDDFELFDQTSLEFLRYLVLGLGNEKLMVVVAGLEEKRFLELIAGFSHRGYFRHLPVAPLGREEVRDLVVSLVGEVAGYESLVDRLLRITGGNPLFAVETMHSLIEGKVLKARGTRWTLVPEALATFQPPRTTTDAVRERLEHLSVEELEVLEVCATATGPSTLDFLAAVLGRDEPGLFSAVAGLKVLGLLRTLAGERGPGYILSSKILEAAVCERLSESRRRANHLRVAETLESRYPEQQDQRVFDLAHHYVQAGVRDRAYKYSVRAGDQARAHRLSEQALDCLETALAFLDQASSSQERVRLMESVGDLRAATWKLAPGFDIYAQCMHLAQAESELAGDSELKSRLLSKMGHMRQEQGRHKEAVDFFDQALLMQLDRSSAASVNILADLGWSYFSLGEFGRAEELLTQALLAAEKPQHNPKVKSELSARTLHYLSVLAYYRSDFVLALQLAEQALRTYENIQDEHYVSKVSQLIATLWCRRGELERARCTYERCLAAQRKSGDVFYLLRSLEGLGVVAQSTGEWQRAFDCFTEALSLAERIGDVTAVADLYANLGATADELGDWNHSLGCFERALELHERHKGDAYGRRIVLANLASLKGRQGRWSEAEQLFSQAWALADATPDPDFRDSLAASEVASLLRQGRLEPARAKLVSALLLVRHDRDRRKRAQLFTLASELRLESGDALRAVGDAGRALSLLDQRVSSKEHAVALRYAGLAQSLSGRPERGLPEIRRCIELLRGLGQRHELALSLMASGQALTWQGPPAAARAGRAESCPAPENPTAIWATQQADLDLALADIKEAQPILRALGALPDEKKADELLKALTRLAASIQRKAQERGEYLKIFHRLSEFISMDLNKEDFCERILGLLIEVTRAERGILFIVHDGRLARAAGRNIDHTTVADAEAVSDTILRKVKQRGEMVFSADALCDPRFNLADSVILHHIRSMLCVPLVVPQFGPGSADAGRSYERAKVIGTIYLDSRVTTHLFSEDDKSLLTSVANLLAATIDKSLAFAKLQEELATMRQDVLIDAETGCVLGKSPAMRSILRVIEKIAPLDCSVLLTGETGTGKGMLARLIHSRSARRDCPFVSIDCGTVPENLQESELFGYIKGAFTDAKRDKPGLFETAEGGTVFLDEIGNASLNTQAKLLQVMDEKVLRRVGGTIVRKANVRLICATNRRLQDDVRAGTFREDLFYRLSSVALSLPPLRERAADIPLFADHFLKHYAKQFDKRVAGFDEDAMTAMAAHSWPGNVRELQHAIEHAVIMTQRPRIARCDMPEQVSAVERGIKRVGGEQVGRDHVLSALKRTKGNVTRAAGLLDIHRRQLQRLMKRYGISRAELGPPAAARAGSTAMITPYVN